MPQSVSLFDVEPVYAVLERGSLVLTPNQRLASRIRNAYVLASREREAAVVKTPRVLSLSGWVHDQWQTLLANAYKPALDLRLMLPHQELLQWQQIVSETAVGQALLRPAATAQQAANAYRLAVEWRLDLLSEGLRERFQAQEDALVWLQWVDSFEQRCREFQLQPPARVPEALIPARRDNVLQQEGAILLVGFQDISPLHRELLDVAGPHEPYEVAPRNPAVARVQCDNLEQEIQAASVWSKQVIRNDPAARVAIVIPELSQQRNRIERLVTEVFEPGYNFLGIQEKKPLRRAPPFNVSAGYPLTEAPVIQGAFNLLALTLPTIDVETVEVLSQSPFCLITSADDDLVARWLVACRRHHCYQLSTATLRQLATDIALGESDAEPLWRFADALQRGATLGREYGADGVLRRDQWILFFRDFLQMMGWPGERRLDSIEYQQVMHWQTAQELFSGHDCSSRESTISLQQAITELRALLGQQVFQPQTADSSLQLLGTLEAAGLQFTHLWLTSMSARQWPPAPRPNPLLPVSLQKQYGMPHSSAEREYEYARSLSRQFVQSADHMVVSAPGILEDNPVHFSPLFNDYPLRELTQVLGRPLHSLLPELEIRRRYFESRKLETVVPGSAPGVEEEEHIGGGSSVFTDQSACPFRAFARHRLHIELLEQPQLGLSPAERGNILHRALELFWNGVGSQAALLQMEEDQLQQRCRQAGHYAVSQFLARSDKKLGTRFLELESERLEQLMLRWMETEKKRAGFTVQATEQRAETHFAGLAVTTRIDRIDRLADDSLLIIDYKSGRASIGDWWSDRPEQPQLPLYTVLAENRVEGDQQGQVSGIAFASLTAERCQLLGAGSEECPESGVSWNTRMKNDSGQFTWEQQKQRWRTVLNDLAQEFIQGRADVDPKHHPRNNSGTCQYCGLQSLCRISHEVPD